MYATYCQVIQKRNYIYFHTYTYMCACIYERERERREKKRKQICKISTAGESGSMV